MISRLLGIAVINAVLKTRPSYRTDCEVLAVIHWPSNEHVTLRQTMLGKNRQSMCYFRIISNEMELLTHKCARGTTERMLQSIPTFSSPFSATMTCLACHGLYVLSWAQQYLCHVCYVASLSRHSVVKRALNRSCGVYLPISGMQGKLGFGPWQVTCLGSSKRLPENTSSRCTPYTRWCCVIGCARFPTVYAGCLLAHHIIRDF